MDGHKTYLDGQWTKLGGTVGKPKTFKPRVTNQVNTCERTQLLWIMCKLKTTNPGLSVSFNSPVALIFKPTGNKLVILCANCINYRPVHL